MNKSHLSWQGAQCQNAALGEAAGNCFRLNKDGILTPFIVIQNESVPS